MVTVSVVVMPPVHLWQGTVMTDVSVVVEMVEEVIGQTVV